jgi:hypothetical protein
MIPRTTPAISTNHKSDLSRHCHRDRFMVSTSMIAFGADNPG